MFFWQKKTSCFLDRIKITLEDFLEDFLFSVEDFFLAEKKFLEDFLKKSGGFFITKWRIFDKNAEDF